VATKRRAQRRAKLKRGIGRENAELVAKEGETLEQLEDTLERLRQLYRRVEQQQLEPDDWTLLAALVREEM
jgi:molybdopterin converting factor small subunit